MLASESGTLAAAEAATILHSEPRNLRMLSIYQIVIRIGWIFKTESVIMPAFVDAVAGAGWVRGWLPTLARVGQSIPPVLYARKLRGLELKKGALAAWSVLLGLPFLVLGAVWWRVGLSPPKWMASLFLLTYVVFSVANGLSAVTFNTLQGRLIRANRRGRLLADSSVTGSFLAIVCAWWLLKDWLGRANGGYDLIFTFTGVCFVVAALAAWALKEPRDVQHPRESDSGGRLIQQTFKLWQQDASFRRLIVVSTLSSATSMLFPHYQALARERLQLGNSDMMLWVVVQNGAVGLFGLFIGPLADRHGNRLALRLAIIATALAPVTAIFMCHLDPALGRKLFWLTFIPLGLTPLSLKSQVSYTLEISRVPDHPKYLSALGLCQMVPFGVSPLIGWMGDQTSFEVIFLGGAVLVVLAAILTFRMTEPRHHATHVPSSEIDPTIT